MSQTLHISKISDAIIKCFNDEVPADIQEFEMTGQAASGRQYFRIPQSNGDSKVLMKSPDIDDDFERFLAIQKILKECGIRVPEVFCVDSEDGFILLEDLGNETLHQAIQGKSSSERFELYAAVVKSLARGHISAIRKTQGEPLLHNRHFDFKDLRWESNYFTKWCLEQKFPEHDWTTIGVQRAFDALAIDVQDHPWDLMHRDFQSQNVMLKEDDWAWIDFQGARLGSTWYDLASLLWDPYVELPIEEIKEHFEAYSSHRKFTGMLQWDHFMEASLQRMMQACGAYGFLTLEKGLSEYEPFKEIAWKQLQTILEHCPESVRLKPILMGMKWS